jgi:hypothetical protein
MFGYGLWFMVFNATFNNISVISCQSVLLAEENRSSGRNPPTCLKSLTLFKVYGNNLLIILQKYVSDCCLAPNDQFFSYIMARKSYISMR